MYMKSGLAIMKLSSLTAQFSSVLMLLDVG